MPNPRCRRDALVMAGLCRAGVVQPVGRNARGVDHPEQVLSSGWGEWMDMMAKRLQAATAHLTPPFAVVDLDELDDNATSMIIRAAGLTIRLATKSIPMPGDHQSCAWA